ncbi:MAG: cell division protein FtsA [Bacteroidales bacterium]|nr:cell division protein FtsA [Candidatus Cryptobacteroides aphodequi]
MQDRYAVTVDLGTSNISLCVAQLSAGTADVVFYKSLPSEGVKHGKVINPLNCGNVLRRLINEAEEALDLTITQAVLAYPSYKVKQQYQIAEVERGDDFITEEEVLNLEATAREEFASSCAEGETIYGSVAQSFNVEDLYQASREDVIGTSSSTLSGNFKIFRGAKRPVENADKVFNHIGKGITREVFTPVISGRIALTEEERENGTALVEIGGGVTSVSIWSGGTLRFFDSFPFAGKSVSLDIKSECSIKEALAENIKLAYGACNPDKLQNLADKVLLIVDEETGDNKKLPIRELCAIVDARMREICEAILWLIARSGMADRLKGGIVLCGGGCQIVGLHSLLREMGGFKVRRAFPNCPKVGVQGFPELENCDAVAQIALLAYCAEDQRLLCTTERQNQGTMFAAAEPAQDEPKSTPVETTAPAPAAQESGKKQKDTKKKDKKESSGLLSLFGKLADETMSVSYDQTDNNNN